MKLTSEVTQAVKAVLVAHRIRVSEKLYADLRNAITFAIMYSFGLEPNPPTTDNE